MDRRIQNKRIINIILVILFTAIVLYFGWCSSARGALGDLDVQGDIRLKIAGKQIRFYNGSYYVGFQAPESLATTQIWWLPLVDGDGGQALITNGSGRLSWATVPVEGGGTDVQAWTTYAIPYLTAPTTFGEIYIGTVSQYLRVNSGANGYEWDTLTWTDVGEKPSEFTPASHGHTYSDITETTSANWATIVSDESGSGQWIFADTTDLSKNDVMMWNGSNWVCTPEGTVFTFSIATFTWNDLTSTTIEMGQASTQWYAIGGIHFDATYNNPPPDATPYVSKTSPGWSSNLSMTGAGYVGPTTTTEATNYPSAINGTRVFTLYAQAGSETSNVSRTITFKNKKYFGYHSQGTILNSSQTISLANTGWVGSSENDLDTTSTSLTPSGLQYVHFLYPSRLDPTTLQFYLGGFETGFTDLGTFTFTNASGYAETYRDYVSPHAYDIATTLVVGATP